MPRRPCRVGAIASSQVQQRVALLAWAPEPRLDEPPVAPRDELPPRRMQRGRVSA